MDEFLDRLISSVTTARTVEELTRPLLEMLQAISGLDSAYLTVIDMELDEQRILFSHNTRTMDIPEGLVVPWGDTLCKRALDEDCPFNANVSTAWGDSQAAKALGIETYLSVPVRLGDNQLYGTLCAASSDSRVPSTEVQRVLALFSTLIAQHIEREQLLNKLIEATETLARHAQTDPLTELPNRRALLTQLRRMIAHGTRAGSHVLVTFVDLDHFKAINDTHGHDFGDSFLTEVARRLQGTLRSEDFAARIGGDEFVVIGHGPINPQEALDAGEALVSRLAQAIRGRFVIGDEVFDYPGASIGLCVVPPSSLDAEQALKAADVGMYEDKRARHKLPAVKAE